jgi:hypothetical protein
LGEAVSEPINIRKIIEELIAGRMRVPNFQRGFVWDPERVAYLMDSIYKGYPFGSILLWRTKQELSHERNLGPFNLPQNDPEYPTDYILDGQQRITSIFGVFQTDIVLNEPPLWSRIFYDFGTSENAQESSFIALDQKDVDLTRHFPLNCFFDPVLYRKETARYTDNKLVARIDKIQARFKEALIPVQTMVTEDKTAVAIVFERVNQRGVELDTVQLLSAWTWSGDFDLNHKFEELAEQLQPFGFSGVGENKNLLLRCCSAVIAADPSPEALIALNGSKVRSSFPQVMTGIKGAIDFLRKNLHIELLDNLPYDNLLVPLAVFYANDENKQHRISSAQRKEILRWFWLTCFSRRYNSQPVKNLKEDVIAFGNLKAGKNKVLTDSELDVGAAFFTANVFRINSVLSRTFVLMLAQNRPTSFISGNTIDLRKALKAYNRHEFHHIYPRNFLRETRQKSIDESCFANICFLSRGDNNAISGVPPSEYKVLMPGDLSEIEKSNFLPGNTFGDDFIAFAKARGSLLAEYANKLLAK